MAAETTPHATSAEDENAVLAVFARLATIHRESAYRLALGVALVAAVLLRLLGLENGICLDEYSSMEVAFSTEFLATLRDYNHPPLYFILLRTWSGLGLAEPILRLLSVVLGVATVAVTAAWLKRTSALAAILAAVLVSSLLILLRYSQEVRGYGLLMLATAAAFHFASACGSETVSRRRDRLGLALSLSAAVMTHLLGIMLLLPTLAYLLIERRKIDRIPGLIAAYSAPILVFAWVYWVFLVRVADQGEFWMPPLSLELARYTVTSLFHGEKAALIVGLSIAVWACLGVRNTQSPVVRSAWACLLACALYVAQILAYSALIEPILWDRTLMPALVPLVGFAGLAVAGAPRGLGRNLGLACVLVVVAANVGRWVSRDAWSPIERFREVAKILAARRSADDLVVVYPDYALGPLQYYDTGLEPETVFVWDRGDEPTAIVDEIERRLSLAGTRSGDVSAQQLHLVLRTANYPEYDELRSLIVERTGASVSEKDHSTLKLVAFSF